MSPPCHSKYEVKVWSWYWSAVSNIRRICIINYAAIEKAGHKCPHNDKDVKNQDIRSQKSRWLLMDDVFKLNILRICGHCNGYWIVWLVKWGLYCRTHYKLQSVCVYVITVNSVVTRDSHNIHKTGSIFQTSTYSLHSYIDGSYSWDAHEWSYCRLPTLTHLLIANCSLVLIFGTLRSYCLTLVNSTHYAVFAWMFDILVKSLFGLDLILEQCRLWYICITMQVYFNL